MALDPLLFDTYKKYKAGTRKVITWLADMAQPSDLLPSAPEAKGKGKGRLKGKARAERKEMGQKHIVTFADILRIAKAIASTATAKVPQAVIQTLEEVIAARSACTDCFVQQGEKDNSANVSNQSHQYFIEVLRETLQLLKPLSGIASQANVAIEEKGIDDKANHDMASIQNRFAHLDVEEPTEWTSSAMSSKSKSKITRSTYELEPTDEDISFAIFCLLKDMTDIRYFVRQTWAEYKEHQITYMTAAVTMNTAISVFERLNQEFVSEFPDFDDHGKIIQYLYNGYCDPNDPGEQSQDFATYFRPDGKVPSKIFFCDNAYDMLKTFYMAAVLFFYQEEYRSDIHPSKDEDASLKCLSILGLLAKEYKGPTWVVFALQLFIDTRRVVGSELQHCLHEAKEHEKWISAALEQSLLFNQTHNASELYKLNLQNLSNLKKDAENHLKKDFVQELLSDRFGGRVARYSWGPYYLFLNHPMLLGLITQQYLVRMHEHGIGLTGHQGSILTSIHLYNAAKQCSQVSDIQEWIDLEKVIKWQGPDWVFVGERPESPPECFKQFLLVTGISASAFSRDRHGKPTMRSHKKPVLPISQNKNRRLYLMSTYADLSNEFFKKAAKIGTLRWTPSRAATEPLAMLERVVAKYLESSGTTTGASVTTRNTKSTADQGPKVHPLSMISVFKDILKSEESILLFDIFALNERCVTLLRKSQKLCVEQSPLEYPLDEFGGDRQINTCFSHMMALESGQECYQPTRFEETCAMVKEFILTSGDEEFRKSQSRCFIKGHGQKKVSSPFVHPFEDNIKLSERSMFSQIFVVDGGPGNPMTIL